MECYFSGDLGASGWVGVTAAPKAHLRHCAAVQELCRFRSKADIKCQAKTKGPVAFYR